VTPTADLLSPKGLKPLQNVAVSSFWRTAMHRPSFHFDGNFDGSRSLRDGTTMPKPSTPLTDTRIRNAKPAEKLYMLSDGAGLTLWVWSDIGTPAVLRRSRQTRHWETARQE